MIFPFPFISTLELKICKRYLESRFRNLTLILDFEIKTRNSKFTLNLKVENLKLKIKILD